MHHLDETDRNILATRLAALDAREGPRVGDWVRFADGTMSRISYLWDDSVQTSSAGSWYLGNGYISFSGALNPGVPPKTLTLSDETREGRVWFFHHDHHRAHNGVDATVPLRVYDCTAPVPGRL